jgi:hypothetical protein
MRKALLHDEPDKIPCGKLFGFGFGNIFGASIEPEVKFPE